MRSSLRHGFDLGFWSWGGLDSNLRPTDYEAAAKESRYLQEWMKALVTRFTRVL
jgi:hypothetical protein